MSVSSIGYKLRAVAKVRRLAALGFLAALACARKPAPSPGPETRAPLDARATPAAAPAARPAPPLAPDADALPAAAELPPERRAIQVVAGSEREVDADAARARGLALVDLGDDWAPSVLAPDNPYRAIYTGLAADRGDGDGQPLAKGEHNYLDLYGISPALSVLRRRFLADAARDCSDVDVVKLLSIDEVRTWGRATAGWRATRASTSASKPSARFSPKWRSDSRVRACSIRASTSPVATTPRCERQCWRSSRSMR